MHPEAYEAVTDMVETIIEEMDLSSDPYWLVDGLDIGGRDNNGNVRGLFPEVAWTVLDIEPGDDVNIVADARTWRPDQQYDVVLCTEVLEHVQHWGDILRTAFDCMRPGGWLVLTAASHLRPPHGARGAALPEPNEWYEGIHPNRLKEAVMKIQFSEVHIWSRAIPGDVYLLARRF